jgi:hypothetical protein
MATHILTAVPRGQRGTTAHPHPALSTRAPWTLLLTAAFALAATATHAQSIAPAGQKSAEAATTGDHSVQGRPWGIVGAWVGTTATGLRQLITFHADGTVLRSVPGEVGIDPARPPHTAAHGVWRYLGHGRFGVTMWDIFYDVTTGQLLHYMRIRVELTLADDRDVAPGRALLETINPQGAVVQSRTGTITFMRIPFEPLP